VTAAQTASARPPVQLNWTPAADAATTGRAAATYQIYRRVNGGPATLYATVPFTTRTFVDTATAAATTYAYYLVAGNDGVVSAASATVGATTPANVAASQLTANASINAPIAGSLSFNAASQVYTVTGSGADPAPATTDRLGLAYRSVTGDVTVSARVVSVSGAAGARAGVAVRASTAADAAFVSVSITPSQGAVLRVRSATGAAVVETTRAGVAPGQYVRVIKTGKTVQAATSPDGLTWTNLGGPVLFTPASYLAGLAVTSTSQAALSTGVFGGLVLTTSVVDARVLAGAVAVKRSPYSAVLVGGGRDGNDLSSGDTVIGSGGAATLLA
jgi:hypothetical protein